MVDQFFYYSTTPDTNRIVNWTYDDLFDDIYYLSSFDADIIPLSISSSFFTAATALSYISDQLERVLKYDKRKISYFK
jgi:hypothetical protein